MVEANTYIKKGDVLISGGGTRAKGYVLATVFEEMVIEVPKTVKEAEYTGKVTSYNHVLFFGKGFNVNKKENYEISDTISKILFNIPYFISVNKIEEYEKNDIIYTYDKESAVKYAATIIEDEFIKNKVLNDEKILRIQELVVIEDEESFKITFLIKKIESIGEFKENV